MLEVKAPIRWPGPPVHYSFSTLEVLKACPRRWAYARAHYEPGGLADERGQLVRRASWAAIRGEIIHEVLEQLLNIHRSGRGPPAGHWSLVRFWREHLPPGGILRLVSDRAAALVERRTAQRRNVPLRGVIRRLVSRDREELVASVNAKLAHALVARSAGPTRGGGAARAGVGAITLGAAAEQRLECSLTTSEGTYNWRGDADVIRVTDEGLELIDYKTGAPKESHKRQLEAYALLIARAHDVNPGGALADKLTLIYEAGQRETWPGPCPDALRVLEGDLVNACRAAEDALREAPPRAQVGPACAWCDARPLCDDYWRTPSGAASTRTATRVDLEVAVTSMARGGAEYGALDGQNAIRLLCTQADPRDFSLTRGDVIRVLGARRMSTKVEVDEEPSGHVLEVDAGAEFVRVPRS